MHHSQQHPFRDLTAGMWKAHRKYAKTGQSTVGKRADVESRVAFATTSVNGGIRTWWGEDPPVDPGALASVAAAAARVALAESGKLTTLNTHVSRGYVSRVHETTSLPRRAKKRARNLLDIDFGSYLAELADALPR